MNDDWNGEPYDLNLHNMVEQIVKDSDDWFGSLTQSLPYGILCLCGETGELANLMKKVQRGSLELDAETRFDMVMEATDIFIYLMLVFAILQYSPAYAYKVKREINEQRFGRSDGGGDGPFRGAPPEPMDEG
jgi:NTP pyrophosphatase (non-canonical NTP hydrolase)